MFIRQLFQRFYFSRMGRGARGQGLAEYALVIVIIGIASIAILTVLGDEIADVWNSIGCSVNDSEECFCTYNERIIKGPQLTCNSTQLIFQTLTSCGRDTELFLEIDHPSADNEVYALSYSLSENYHNTALTVDTALCNDINSFDPPRGWIISRHTEDERTNRISFGFGDTPVDYTQNNRDRDSINDRDKDGIDDAIDNCPFVFNPSQFDADPDTEAGEACEEGTGTTLQDHDGDSVPNGEDNCPYVYNPVPLGETEQSDVDGDGIGDACDGDTNDYDGDGYTDDPDNCPFIANPGQEDSNGNGVGDVCDPTTLDSDSDGKVDADDNCPDDYNPLQEDADNDGLGDVCDDLYGIGGDYDEDGYSDTADNCPYDPNPGQEDLDGDGRGDACDEVNENDLDEDGKPGSSDNCPTVYNPEQTDTDPDTPEGDACDPHMTDRDNDGVSDFDDNCVDYANTGQEDGDGDGVGDTCDVCPAVPDETQLDTDGNGIGDACDASSSDSDGDGVDDSIDNCPYDSNPQQFDRDVDGVGDACDYTYRVNFGSNKSVVMNGKVFEAERGLTAYELKWLDEDDYTVSSPATDNAVYRSLTHPNGDRPMTFEETGLPNGTYDVILYFIENNTSYNHMDISVQGDQRWTDYAPYNEVGLRIGTTLTYNGASVTNGTLQVIIDGHDATPVVSGIEIIGSSGGSTSGLYVAPPGAPSVNVGETTNVSIQAGGTTNSISLSVINAPSFTSFSDGGSGTGTLTASPTDWSVILQEAGYASDSDRTEVTFRITAKATAGSETALQTFNLIVRKAGQGPRIVPIGDQEVNTGQKTDVVINVQGTGPITIRAIGLISSFMEIVDYGGGSGLLRLTPAIGAETKYPATYPITIFATDGNGMSASESINIKVIDDNQARVTLGLKMLYYFSSSDISASGVIPDVSGEGAPVNLQIEDMSKTTQLVNGLRLQNASIISLGAATKLLASIDSGYEYTIEVWLRPENTEQDGPARIVTSSIDTSNGGRNFTLGQVDDKFNSRTITGTSTNREFETVAGAVTTNMTHVVVTRARNVTTIIYVNAVNRGEAQTWGNMDRVKMDYPIVIGNEYNPVAADGSSAYYGIVYDPGNDRFWNGDIFMVALYDRALTLAEVRRNYDARLNRDN